MLTRNQDRLHAVACALSLFFAGITAAGIARAETMDKAIAVVKGASDEDLRKEVERRSQKKKDVAKPAATATRGLATGPAAGLATLDDAQLLTAAHVTSRSIYGADDRKDWYQMSPADHIEPLARASVALFDGSKVEAPSGGTVRIKAKSFQDVRHLCPTPKARFADQPSAAFCSGTLVRPDMVLTAGHCVREISGNEALPPDVTGIKFVFGFALQTPNADATTLPAANVFTGKEVIGGENGDHSDAHRHDWALVRLDKPVPASVAEPVTNWETATVAKGARVFVIGFPAGMPLKYAPGASVRDASNDAWFVANLDTFGGNSGSGVYDQASKKLVGVLVEGELDYKADTARSCYLVNLCPDNGCSGETVSRLGQVRVP
jgi:V8-like Glu-specific endopeptidase